MASSTDKAAIRKMVADKYATKPIDRIVGRPTHDTVRIMMEQLEPIAAGFDTSQWGGQHGCLLMVLGGTKYKAVVKKGDVPINSLVKPANNATFSPSDDDTGREKKRKALATTWKEYYLQQAVNAVGVDTIVAATEKQYTEKLKKPYLGFHGVTIIKILEQLRRWYTISHKERINIKKRFEAPWSETPDAHVTTYGNQLDLWQDECSDLNVVVSNEDKTLLFVQQMYDSELFTRRFMDEWEDAPANTWKATIEHFASEYGKIGREKQREAEREAAGYSSAASLTLTQPQPPTTDASNKAATKALAAVSEYAAALEARVDELESIADDGANTTASPVLTMPTMPNLAAAATTVAGNSDLAELKAMVLVQQKQMDSALTEMKKMGDGGGDGGRRTNRRDKKGGKKKHVCKNCKRMVYHDDDKCMELEKNANLRYEGWKSCLEWRETGWTKVVGKKIKHKAKLPQRWQQQMPQLLASFTLPYTPLTSRVEEPAPSYITKFTTPPKPPTPAPSQPPSLHSSMSRPGSQRRLPRGRITFTLPTTHIEKDSKQWRRDPASRSRTTSFARAYWSNAKSKRAREARLKAGVLDGSIPSAAFDTACTLSAGKPGDPFLPTNKKSTKVFALADDHPTPASMVAKLYHEVREPARTVDIVPALGRNSLLSGGKFAEAGYVSICDDKEVNIYDGRTAKIVVSEEAVLKGWRCPYTNL